MFNKKQKLVTTVTALTLGCGFTFGLTPAFADSTKVSANNTHVHSIQNQEQEQEPFTGYVISIENNYLVVAATPTKDEALTYQHDWWDLVSQNKILRVPVSDSENYKLGEKLNVYAVGWTASLPPIAVMPTIEKLTQ
ncbi:DUF3221 domain-containing protein [Bacillus sp. FSL L8-0199]|uniref:DUF3221 domain-containing protein n=1 Tax=Bacillus thuringiensis TaxID=1428 RepID=A0AB36V2I0_BACTU|nr:MULTISPECIES: DUF3221 domain-containing protein [Bacillus cereus group]MCU5759593.1 DUF3221 domain-containing protein [Bacillus cereus]MEE3960085.1 DUF3221 domain-containing protein [Bacillus thuringiensis]OUB31160.1 DUF3221 domain-containing protein [Bacillus thuringiensis serovar pirenaica]PEC69801.1 DUF3221 domain-containing protein [Bacillus thuringiensis]PGL88682.1 DUF3221 domain-containing protein [Bacillus thuringiensis]